MRAGRSIITARHGVPLVVRASLPRTFLGLGIFVEGCLIFTGAYLLLECLRSPLEARPEAVISAGVLLSLATMLLFYLVGPKGSRALAREDDAPSGQGNVEVPLTVFGESVQSRRKAEQAMVQGERLPGPM